MIENMLKITFKYIPVQKTVSEVKKKTCYFLYSAFWSVGYRLPPFPHPLGHATSQTLEMHYVDFVSSLLLLVKINEIALYLVFQSFPKDNRTTQYLIFCFFVQ